eukprot:8691586-Pyramimonas_sp.AAC.1
MAVEAVIVRTGVVYNGNGILVELHGNLGRESGGGQDQEGVRRGSGQEGAVCLNQATKATTHRDQISHQAGLHGSMRIIWGSIEESRPIGSIVQGNPSNILSRKI